MALRDMLYMGESGVMTWVTVAGRPSFKLVTCSSSGMKGMNGMKQDVQACVFVEMWRERGRTKGGCGEV
jgi:hypothetical protein